MICDLVWPWTWSLAGAHMPFLLLFSCAHWVSTCCSAVEKNLFFKRRPPTPTCSSQYYQMMIVSWLWRRCRRKASLLRPSLSFEPLLRDSVFRTKTCKRCQCPIDFISSLSALPLSRSKLYSTSEKARGTSLWSKWEGWLMLKTLEDYQRYFFLLATSSWVHIR